jgi:hypothetical protein
MSSIDGRLSYNSTLHLHIQLQTGANLYRFLNILYLPNTQINHLILSNVHTNKINVESMVHMLQPCTQSTTLCKVKARDIVNAINKHINYSNKATK